MPGATLPVGVTQTIRWTTTGLPATGSVKVELSRNGGVSWTTLATSAPNSGSFAWMVSGTPTHSAVVRVTSVSSPTVLGLSQPFSISQPTLFLISPNGGEQLRQGNQALIQWSGTTLGAETVTINLTRDFGKHPHWTTIFQGIPNTGNVFWGVSGKTTKKARVQIIGTRTRRSRP